MGHSGEDILVSFPALAAEGIGYDGKTRYYALEWRTNLLDGTWQPIPGYSNILGQGQLILFTNESMEQILLQRGKAWLSD